MFLENVCYWSFDILETKLKTKLQTMALIHGVTEDKDGEKYYKYIEMHIYKLRGFLEFLDLLNKGDIFIGCHIEEKDASEILNIWIIMVFIFALVKRLYQNCLKA